MFPAEPVVAYLDPRMTGCFVTMKPTGSLL
jgi:hypothetical protein